MCHSKSKNLEKYTKEADILIVAVGKKELIKKDMVKNDAVIIDVGINRENNKLSSGDLGNYNSNSTGSNANTIESSSQKNNSLNSICTKYRKRCT